MIFHRLLLSSNNKIPFRPIITFPVNQEELFEFDLICVFALDLNVS